MVSGSSVERLYYDGDNCTGQAYIDGALVDTVISGAFKTSAIETYYARKYSIVGVDVKSYLYNQSCVPHDRYERGLSRAYTNDSSVTGIDDIVPRIYQFDMPITMEER